jgi:hypothetical protein
LPILSQTINAVREIIAVWESYWMHKLTMWAKKYFLSV